MGKLRMPIGIDDFDKLRKNDFYYVDKTGMIKELLENWGEVNLFTRPRRFGKSMNMSTLKYSKKEANLETDAREALNQIASLKYDNYFGSRKPDRIVHYGITFYFI